MEFNEKTFAFMKKKGPTKGKKSNKKPEGDFQTALTKYLKLKGFKVTSVEAKGIYIPSIKRHVSSKTKKGTSDILACCPDGRYVAIECKAPGKLRTASEDQIDYLVDIIKRNGFGMVCDSIDSFTEAWNTWTSLTYREPKQEFLMRLLPRI